MKKRHFLVLFFFVTVTTSNAQSDEYTWHNFNTSNSILLDNVIQTLAINHYDGSVWAAYPGSGGSGLGVAKFDDGTWVNYNTTNSGLPCNDIRAIATDHDHNMWFACYNAGIVKFDGTNWTVYNTSNSGIVGNNATTIKIDSENNVWIGVYADGVSKFDGTNWTNYTSSNAPFQNYSCINDIVIDDSHNVWVGMECDGALAKLDVSGNWTTFATSNSDLAHNNISSMIKDNSGNLWVGFINNEKVSSFNGATWETYSPFINATNSVAYSGFAIDADGDIWCHTSAGLYEFSDGAWSHVMVPQFGNSDISAINIANDSKGNIWWGSYSGLWTNNIDVCNQFLEGFVSQVEDHLVVSDENVVYQWKDCTIDQEISGEINREFAPQHSGTYAVHVLTNGCKITSECFAFAHCDDILKGEIIQVDDHLIVSDENAEYQWIDCDTGLEIASSTNQTFTPATSGSYQVRVSKDHCTLTSVCFDFSICDLIIEAAVSQEDNHLVVSDEDAEYQWIDCFTDLEIAGATAKTFTPSTSGFYQVRISKNDCSVNSMCIEFNNCEFIIDAEVNQEDDHLMVSDDDGTYQWIDCATSLAIPSATDNFFAPEASGDYSVQISKDGCLVTSSCFAFEKMILGVRTAHESNLRVFPNPATHQVTIDLGKKVSHATISIKASNGAIVWEGKIVDKKDITLETKSLTPGLYFVFINVGSSSSQVKKLLIN